MIVVFEQREAQSLLADTSAPLAIIKQANKVGVYRGDLAQLPANVSLIGLLPAFPVEQLGDNSFCVDYGSRYAYMTGAMANGIASAELVIALGQSGLLGSYGAGGVLPDIVEKDVIRIKQALGTRAFAVNLIHAPHETLMEQRCVDILLKHDIRVIEASAFMNLTPALVQFRLAGLYRAEDGSVQSHNKVIAKVSHTDVAKKFMSAAPESIVKALLAEGKITTEQASLATQLPVADDITAEADSGGHTDRRPLVSLLPLLINLRDRLAQEQPFKHAIRIGAAGGIATPESAFAAFAMGAAYVVTGSVNQSCVESGSSEHVRDVLSKASMTDVEMAPAADMFEMGVQLQVLKLGTLFPMRAKHLYQLYQSYDSLEAIPQDVRQKLETQLFKRSLDQVWQETCDFFNKRDPQQIERANNDPKRRMALIFRSYLGQSSMWANTGVKGREVDYQIWAGPAMGAFNDWVQQSYLAEAKNRSVVDVAEHLMRGCALQNRQYLLQSQNIDLPQGWLDYQITPLVKGERSAA